MIRKMCLLCMDRTGSNMISSRLNTHPEIVFYNEIFHRQYIIFQDDRVVGDKGAVARRDKDPAAFVSRVWNGECEPADKRAGLTGVGFKLFLSHNADALRYVVNSDAALVWLRRRNPLSRFSSFKIAAATNEWKLTNGGPAKKATVPFHAAEFRAYVENYRSLEALAEMVMNRWNRAHFPIWYEDFVRSPQVWDDMVGFLGYDPAAFGQSPLRKQNSSDLLERFSNPEAVQEYVASVGRYDWLTE